MDYIVLVPIEDGTLSSDALAQALAFARGRPQVALVGLHVVNVVPSDQSTALQALLAQEPSPVPADVAAWYRAEGEALLHRFATVCADAGVRHQTCIEVGGWSDEVRRHGEAADLVMLARPPEDDEPSPGETPAYVDDAVAGLRGAVAIIPKETPPAERLILGWSDGPTAQRALRAASRLARATGLPLEVLIVHGHDEPAPRSDLVRRHLDLVGLAARIDAAPGVPWEALTARAAAGPPALVVVGGSDKSRWGRRLWGSTADSLLERTDLGVIIVS